MEFVAVFHRGIGSDDEAATVQERCEKILFFHSFGKTNPDPEHQMFHVSTCEALIDLCLSFNNTCESIFTCGSRYALLECEPQVWFVLCVRTVAFSVSKAKGKQLKLPKEGGDTGESVHGEPDVRVMRSILRKMYRLFRLLFGPIHSLLDADGVPSRIKELRRVLRKARKYQVDLDDGDLVPDCKQTSIMESRRSNEDKLAALLALSPADKVRENLNAVFPLYLKSINLSNLHAFYHLQAQGVYHFPLDKATYLSIQYFMQLLKHSFTSITSAALLFNGQLLWTTLQQQPTLDIVNYVRIILSSHTGDFTKPGFLALGRKAGVDKEKATPLDATDTYAPQCFLFSGDQDLLEEQGSSHRLCAYQFKRATVVVVTKDVEDTWNRQQLLAFCGELESFVCVELERLAVAISKSSDLHSGAMGSPRVLHDNQDNRSRYVMRDKSNSVLAVSHALMFPGKVFFKQQHEQLVDQMKLLHVFEHHDMVLGAREVGQGLSMSASSALNSLVFQFDSADSEIMESFLSVPPAIVPSLLSLGFHSRSQRTGKSGMANFIDPGCWLVGLKADERQVFFLLDRKLSLHEAVAEYLNLRTLLFPEIIL